jgi:tRNA (uracil-5-)-methyltransferase TRM9
MEAEVVEKIIELNRQFYAQFAVVFSDSRSIGRTNLQAIMPYLRAHVKLLDVGCGNGRVAGRLEREGMRVQYTGVDATPTLLAVGASQAKGWTHVRAEFQVADVMHTGWAEVVRERAPFDAAVALAFLHHVPSFALRCKVLEQIRSLLATNGVVIMSNWQFERSSRLRRKLVPWSTAGIAEEAVEPGDALIDWQRGGSGFRYCHMISKDEVEAMAEAARLRVVTQFAGDGGMNLYSVLEV